MKFIIEFLIALYLFSKIVHSQREFVNPAIQNPAPCACDARGGICDANCCCDPDCSSEDVSASNLCPAGKTTYSSPISEEPTLYPWNCSNSDSDADYDYFPFVCYQLKLNEVIGTFYQTRSISFVTSASDASTLHNSFTTQNSQLLLTSSTLTTTAGTYQVGSPVVGTSSTVFQLPGSLTGINCQNAVPVLFGINRDVTCVTNPLTSLCNNINAVTSVSAGGTSASASITVKYFSTNYTAPIVQTRDVISEYYFGQSSSFSISSITNTSGQIYDYCSGFHPYNRIQRYYFCSGTPTACTNSYQSYTGCPVSTIDLTYGTIPFSAFNAPTASKDTSTNFADFNGYTNVSTISCTSTGILRIFYRFNYSSFDNTIASVEVFALLGTATNTRINVEWNDVYVSPSSKTTIRPGYLEGDVLQFLPNNSVSAVTYLVPTSSGLCIDATRQTVRYKMGVSSTCFVQVQRSTVQQCRDLKILMYLNLNAFYTPASDVFAYPSTNATTVSLRDTTQLSIDLNRIDITRDQLTPATILLTQLSSPAFEIYDAGQALATCFDVPSGIYIEFRYVRVTVSPTFTYERIVSVVYNYTFSDWSFDCTRSSCADNQTQRFPVTFQTAFVDYTSQAFYLSDTTRADLTYADNYIQHLLWLISPEYKGEPGYRNYTIAMILIFIFITVCVIHVLLFGLMLPF